MTRSRRVPDAPASVRPVPASGGATDETEAGARQVHRRRRRRKRQRVVARGWLEAHSSKLGVGLLAAVVAGSALAIGTVHVVALLAVAPFALAAGALALATERLSLARLPAPVWLMIALALYCVLQAIPLPIAIVQSVAARNAIVWRGSLELVGDAGARFFPVSLDPGATLVEALKWTCYASVFAVAAFVARERGLHSILAIVFGSALAVALITLAHRATGATRLYGLYKPEFAAPPFALAPLLNANNLAGYLNLGAFAGMGLVVARDAKRPRWLLALGVSVVVAVSSLSASRGGWLSLLMGVPLLVFALRRTRGSLQGQRRRVLIGLQLGALGCGLALFLLGATENVWKGLHEESLKKLDLLNWSRPLIAQHPWVGVGRGAFETAFPAYRGDFGHHIYAHAENFVAQWCSEWGLPVALLALGAFVWMFRPRALDLRHSASATSAYVGVVVLLAHNLVDLALEVASVSIALAAVLGGLWGASRSRAVPKLPDRLPFPAGSAAVALLGTALIGLVVVHGTHSAVDDRAELGHAVATSGASPRTADVGDLLGNIKSAIRRHPADPFLPMLGAVVLARTGGNALPWIARAIERDAMEGRPHMLLAYILATHGARDQALLETKLAVERDSALSAPGSLLVLGISHSFDELLRAVPPGTAGANFLVSLARRVKRVPELRAKLLEEAMRRDADFETAAVLRADDLLTDLAARSGACGGQQRPTCIARVQRICDALARAPHPSDKSVVIHARLLMTDGNLAEAQRVLAKGCLLEPDYADCWRLRVLAVPLDAPPDALNALANAYLDIACRKSRECSATAMWLGDQLARHRDWRGAARMYERSARESGSKAAWQRTANAASRAGMDALAMHALRHVGSAGSSQALRR